MSTIQAFCSIVASWLCLSDPNQPKADEIKQARFNAIHVVGRLRWLDGDVAIQCPWRTDMRAGFGDLMNALAEDHGGELPDILLKTWSMNRDNNGHDSNSYTPQQRRALDKVLERWKDSDKVDNAFGCLKAGEIEGSLHQRMTDERLSQLKQFTQDWFQKRRTGDQYGG